MIVRGDLGKQIAMERLPFVRVEITDAVKVAGVSVITATEMLASMVDNDHLTCAEVTDVAYVIIYGSDAVMLSEETAQGKYPVGVVATMKSIVAEVERVRFSMPVINAL